MWSKHQCPNNNFDPVAKLKFTKFGQSKVYKSIGTRCNYPSASTISNECKSVIWLQLTFKLKLNDPHF